MGSGWDDPLMFTVVGLRRRGYPPEAINDFVRSIGVTRSDNKIEFTRLEQTVRLNLNTNARRGFAVLEPLKVTLTNLPEDFHEWIDAPNFPQDKSRGVHRLSLTR